MRELHLPGGCAILDPFARLLAFCAEEHMFYDAVHDLWPNHVSPVDVAITIAVNSFVNTATRLRQVQRGLAEACDPTLAEIPADARLEEATGVHSAVRLIDASVAVPSVLVPVATKVIHRKRRGLVPMLDQVVLDYYLDATGNAKLKASTQDKRRLDRRRGARPCTPRSGGVPASLVCFGTRPSVSDTSWSRCASSTSCCGLRSSHAATTVLSPRVEVVQIGDQRRPSTSAGPR